MNNNLVEREKEMENLLINSVPFLEKGYLADKKNFEVISLSGEEQNSLNFSQHIRMIHLTKLSYEEKENVLDKLSNIFTSLYGNETSVFLLLDSSGKECNFYLGVKDKNSVTKAFSTLKSSINGNFPGVEYEESISNEHIEKILTDVYSDRVDEITVVTGVPSLKDENKEKFLQGIEKVIDGMQGKQFSAIFLAEPVNYESIKEIKKGYENMYDQLYPYLNMTLSLNKSEAVSVANSLGETFTKSYTESLNKTTSTSESETIGKNSSKTKGYSGNAGLIGMGIGFLIGGPTGALIGGGIASGLGSVSFSSTSGESSSKSKSFSESNTKGESYGETKGTQTTKTDTKTETEGKIIQINQKNKSIENLLKKIEQHIERIESAEGNGMWTTGTYFLSKEPQNSVVAANIYNGIIRGKISGVEKNSVCVFNEENELEEMKDYLYNFLNPKIKVNLGNLNLESTMGSLITNDELALKMNFPKKSVAGLDVIKTASFGRNIKNSLKEIKIGNLYHLGKIIDKKVGLDIESLTSHTFITGSTGAGKSNAVYMILNELRKKDIKFLVVEPAKGEYKDIFGGRSDVKVYGTNIKFTELLKINPFSFNENIHILEHIDRLTEIFNACWPMYAAMPAILKDAIEKSYVMMGWDLKNSINLFGEKKCPTFKELKESLDKVINSSEYSQETKGNYIGALVTRVNSLANGITGNIFVEDEISEQKLFDENVILDISRIPSAETKSLIMGIVFMKLHEYRMSNPNVENSNLKHVTVLEEAHNLLKRTNTEQATEGANLQGKSVEMMSNAIAEMRTYGEGFIIADQAPGLLDLSVIRNTNTKICLKLPNLEDRELVGRAMNLNDEQINELAKLETGVAAIIQSNWKESCLVKFDYMSDKYRYSYQEKENSKNDLKKLLKHLLEHKLPKVERITYEEEQEVRKKLREEEKNRDHMSKEEIDEYIYRLLNAETILQIVNLNSNIENIYEKSSIILNNLIGTQKQELLNTEIINSIIRHQALKDEECLKVYTEWNKFIKEGREI